MRLKEAALRWEGSGWTLYDLGPATEWKSAGWSTGIGPGDLDELIDRLLRNCRSIRFLPPLAAPQLDEPARDVAAPRRTPNLRRTAVRVVGAAAAIAATGCIITQCMILARRRTVR
jgi:hypothetical protein